MFQNTFIDVFHQQPLVVLHLPPPQTVFGLMDHRNAMSPQNSVNNIQELLHWPGKPAVCLMLVLLVNLQYVFVKLSVNMMTTEVITQQSVRITAQVCLQTKICSSSIRPRHTSANKEEMRNENPDAFSLKPGMHYIFYFSQLRTVI